MARNGLGRWRTIGLLIAYSAAYWVWAVRNGATRLLWFDEILTVNIVRLPDMATIWSALMQGADGNPPMYHLAVRVCWRLLGPTPVATRLPAMAGFYVFGLCLYRFVSRHCGPWYAWAALLIPFSTAAVPFACEARPYGLLLASASLSLVAWQAASEGRARWLALPLLALSLAMGVASHYYAVLLSVPIAAGELTRLRGRRQIDWGVAVASAAGLSVLIPFMPMARALQDRFAKYFWAQPSYESIPHAYDYLLGHALGGTILAVALIAALAARGSADISETERNGLEPHEWAAAWAFALMPFYGYLLAVLATGALADRYLLPATAGFAILLPAAVHRLSRGRRWGPILAVSFLVSAPVCLYWDYSEAKKEYVAESVLLDPIRPYRDQPLRIVVTDPMRFTQLSHYAPANLTARLVYVGPGLRTVDRILEALSPWNGMQIETVEPFLEAHRGERVVLYASMKDEVARRLVNDLGGLSMGFVDETNYSGIIRIPVNFPGVDDPSP